MREEQPELQVGLTQLAVQVRGLVRAQTFWVLQRLRHHNQELLWLVSMKHCASILHRRFSKLHRKRTTSC